MLFGKDGNVEIRLLEENDAETIAALSKIDQGSRWFDFPGSHDNILSMIRQSQKTFAEGKDFCAGIWLGDEVTGIISLEHVNLWNRTAMLGYCLGRDYRGRGLVTRSCRLLIHYAFNEMRLNRLEIPIATANQKSRAVAERLGCTLEGIHRKAERFNPHIHGLEDFSEEEIFYQGDAYFFDHAMYSLLRTEWIAG